MRVPEASVSIWGKDLYSRIWAAPYTTPTSQLKEFTTKVGKKLLDRGWRLAMPGHRHGAAWTS